MDLTTRGEEIRKVLLSLKEKEIDYFGQSFERRYTNPLRYGISDGSWENYCDGDKLSRWDREKWLPMSYFNDIEVAFFPVPTGSFLT